VPPPAAAAPWEPSTAGGFPNLDMPEEDFGLGAPTDVTTYQSDAPSTNVNPPMTAASASVPFNAPPPSADPTGEAERAAIAKQRILAARQAMGKA
jgi:hypothetical protein